jgi:metallo-beta-lactamase family protein
LERFVPRGYDNHTLSKDIPHLDISNAVSYELGIAGHLLGSAWVSLESHDRRVVFSADLGGRSAHLPAIQEPPTADALFLESTYGDRQQHRSLKSARSHLYQETLKAVKSGIPVLIPTFAVGRAQEVMQIFRERFPQEPDEVQEQLEVVYDGMARDATAAYHAYSIGEYVNEKINNWRMNSQDNEPFLPDCAWYPEDTAERSPILDGERAPIIVAPSGMLSGGTSPAYLAALVEHYDEARIFFTGYQAEDTPGRVLQDASGSSVEVTLPATPFPNSELDTNDDGTVTVTVPTSWIQIVSGFSGHCARQKLYEFVQDVDAQQIKLIHGPPTAQKECRNYFDNNLDTDDISRASMMEPVPIQNGTGSSQPQTTPNDNASGEDDDSGEDGAQGSAETEAIPTGGVSDSMHSSTEDSQTDEPTLVSRVEMVEDRVDRLESEVVTADDASQWTEDELRQLIQTEITTHLNIKPSEDTEDKSRTVDAIDEIDGIGAELTERLKHNGFETFADIESASLSALTELDQVGEATAEKILSHV